MQTEDTNKPANLTKKPGRPVGYVPPKPKGEWAVSVEGDYVVIKVPKKDLGRKLLAELI